MTNLRKLVDGRPRKTIPEYFIWKGMIARCHRPTSSGYSGYGARGVTVCERWRSDFAAFLQDMGRRPSPAHTIDRKNNAIGYEPGNCRWITNTEQQRNKTSNVWLTLDGRRQLLIDWALEVGIPHQTLRHRLKSGWTAEEILRTPLGGRPHHKTRAKLTIEQVREIRRRRAAGEFYHVLATAFGVSAGTICFAVKGETWRDA